MLGKWLDLNGDLDIGILVLVHLGELIVQFLVGLSEGVGLGGLDVGYYHLGEELKQVLEKLVVSLLLSSRGKAGVYHHLDKYYKCRDDSRGKEGNETRGEDD